MAEENDPIHLLFDQWIDHHILSQGPEAVSNTKLYESFLTFLDGSMPVTKILFGRRLAALFYRESKGAEGVFYYVNRPADYFD